jgi:hypothetical protein
MNSLKRSALLAAAAALAASPALAQVDLELAGNALAQYPFFEFVRAFNADASVQVAIDPTRLPGRGRRDVQHLRGERQVGGGMGGGPVARGRAADGPADRDLRGRRHPGRHVHGGGPRTAPELGGTDHVGRGYDVVLDCDLNGTLGAPDYIDGRVAGPRGTVRRPRHHHPRSPGHHGRSTTT